MERIEARVKEKKGKHFIVIDLSEEELVFPLSEDKPAEVKKAFNRLLVKLKEGAFSIELGDVGDDLFSQVASEYIKQLNKEMAAVRAEMVQYGLADG
jgi:uncharacterized protein (UPF0128 family)